MVNIDSVHLVFCFKCIPGTTARGTQKTVELEDDSLNQIMILYIPMNKKHSNC